MTTEEVQLVTVLQTAELLHVHPRTVWRYIEHGRLSPVRHPMSRRVYLRRSEVIAARERARQRLASPRPERHTK